MTVSELVAAHARHRPDAPAYVTPDERMTWQEYDDGSCRLFTEWKALPRP